MSAGAKLWKTCSLKVCHSNGGSCAQVREIRLDYREATGPCKARTLAQKLWAGEEYYLQLDAHMRFTPGWDEDLIQWLHGIEIERPGSKPVLSTYPPGYEVRPSCPSPS